MTDTNAPISTEAKSANKRPRKMAREPKAETASSGASAPAPAAKRQSKADLVLGLLQRGEGATIEQLVEATGWLPHTTRAALTGLKKKGHSVVSDKREGGSRNYRVVAA